MQEHEREREREKAATPSEVPTFEYLRIGRRLRNYEARAAERKSYNFLIKCIAAEWKRSEAVVCKERKRERERLRRQCRQWRHSRIGARSRER
jgi:hypothetical protein